MTALEKALQPIPAAIAVTALFALQIFLRFGSDLNHDTAWYLYVAQGMLDGGKLYHDFIEVNPPLAIWLTLPIVMFARVAGLSPFYALYAAFFLATAFSLLLVWRCFAKLGNFPRWQSRLVLVSMAVGLLFIPGPSFGQREHLLVQLFAPWLVVRFVRFQGAQISVAESAIVGLLAGVAICLKPQTMLAPLAVEAMIMLRGKNFRTVLVLENVAAAIFAFCYGMAVLLLYPNFVPEMMELGVRAYIPYYGYDASLILKRSAPTAAVLLLALLLQRMARGSMRELSGLALAAALGFLVAYFFQAKGYLYQIIPAQIVGALAGCCAFAGISGGTSGVDAKKLHFLAAIVVAAIGFLSIPAQNYVYRGQLFSEAISKYRPDAKSIFIASTNVFNGFPLTNRENLIWGSRFPALWLVPYVSDKWRGGPLPEDPVIAYALDVTVTDLQKFQPEVVFINQGTSQDYVRGGSFDYLEFMNQDSRFAAIWDSYELRGQAGPFAIYTIRGP